MLKKSLQLILFVFTLQIVTSCFVECGEPKTFEINYNSAVIIPCNTSGFYYKEVEDSVFKNTFGLIVGVESELIQIAENHKLNLSIFKSAMALSCVDDTYLFPDPIKNIELFITDKLNDEELNATELFKIKDYNQELVSLEDFFIIRDEWHDGFEFELTEYQNLPDSATFKVEVYLESGIIFTEETETVYFINI